MTRKKERQAFFKSRHQRQLDARKAALNNIALTPEFLSYILGFQVLAIHIALCQIIINNPKMVVLVSTKVLATIKANLPKDVYIGCYFLYNIIGSYVGQSVNLPERVYAHIRGASTIKYIVQGTSPEQPIYLNLYIIPGNVVLGEITIGQLLILLEYILIHKFYPTANINFLPTPGGSTAESTMEKYAHRGLPVYMYLIINGIEVLIHTFLSANVMGPQLGKSPRWGYHVLNDIQGLYKNTIFVSQTMLDNRASNTITCAEITSILENAPSASHTNTCVIVVNGSTNQVSIYTMLEVVLLFDVSVQSVLFGTEKVYNGHTYTFVVAPLNATKKAGPTSAVIQTVFTTTATSKPLFIYMEFEKDVLTLVHKFDGIGIAGLSLGFNKEYGSRVIRDHKGWYRKTLFFSKTEIINAPVSLMPLETLQKIVKDKYNWIEKKE